MSAFERDAVLRLLDKAIAAGAEIPERLRAQLFCDYGGYAGRKWVELHPEDADTFRGCCWGDTNDGPAKCSCWVPVFDVEQADPLPPTAPADIAPADDKCHDCAFRKGSPELADGWTRDALFDGAREGRPFWCHQGMRRPVLWRHPDGREVPGSPDDWQPPTVSGIPYRADGSPAQLCAGWTAAAATFAEQAERLRAGAEGE